MQNWPHSQASLSSQAMASFCGPESNIEASSPPLYTFARMVCRRASESQHVPVGLAVGVFVGTGVGGVRGGEGAGGDGAGGEGAGGPGLGATVGAPL